MKVRETSIEAQQESNRVNDKTIGQASKKRRKKLDGSVEDLAGEGGDTVEVSLSKQIQNEMQPNPRVAELKELIKNGKYNPDPRKVAEAAARFIDDEISYERLSRNSS